MQVVTQTWQIKVMPHNSLQMINLTLSFDVLLPRGTLKSDLEIPANSSKFISEFCCLKQIKELVGDDKEFTVANDDAVLFKCWFLS